VTSNRVGWVGNGEMIRQHHHRLQEPEGLKV